jgi:signal transduction histidine kinase
MSIDEPPDPTTAECARLRRHLEVVRRVTATLCSTASWDGKEQQIREAAMEAADAEAGTVYLHDVERQVLIFKHVVNADREVISRLKGVEMPDGRGVVGEVVQTATSRITRLPDGSGSMLTVPIRGSSGGSVGALQVIRNCFPEFDERDRELLEILAAHVGAVLEMARLHEEARRASIIHLVGDISHDVKNFLTPVVTGSQTLEMEIESALSELDQAAAGLEPEGRARVLAAVEGLRGFYSEAMEMVYDGARDTQERVREIADAVKGVIAEPCFRPSDFRKIAEDVADVLRLEARRRGVVLDLSGVEEVAAVELDSRRIYNALYNLVNNALVETPTAGSVHIRAQMIDRAPEGWLKIEVADTGRGMPEEVRRRLFTEHAVSTKPGGTGLGTRIVKNVVDLHGGEIAVDSELGRGTRFTIQIPARQPGLGA